MLALLLVSCLQVPANVSAPDAEGKRTIRFDLPREARPTPLGSQPGYREQFCAAIPGGMRITRARTFIGLDAGARAEIALDVVINGQEIANRSEHKEADGIYDSWRSAETDYLMPAGPNEVHLLVRGWTTNGGRTNLEVGLVLEVRPR